MTDGERRAMFESLPLLMLLLRHKNVVMDKKFKNALDQTSSLQFWSKCPR